MAVGDTMQGRRLELEERDGKPRLPGAGYSSMELGDYAGPIMGYTGDKPMVAFRLPNGEVGHVCEPPHAFTEEADGSLTISPSILLSAPSQPERGWHGYLEHGVWREV